MTKQLYIFTSLVASFLVMGCSKTVELLDPEQPQTLSVNISSPNTGDIVPQSPAAVTVSGTCSIEGATIQVSSPLQNVNTTCNSGNWTTPLDVSLVAHGPFNITATLLSSNGAASDFVSVDKDGNSLLTPTITPGGDTSENFQTTADGQKVVFIADLETNNTNELFVADVTALTSNVKISDITAGRNVTKFVLGSGVNLGKVLYMADRDTSGLQELYSVNLDGTNHNKINLGVTTLTIGETLDSSFKFSPISGKVFWTSDAEGQRALYMADLDGANRVAISAGPITDSDDFQIAPNGVRVVFREGLTNPTLLSRIVLPVLGSVATLNGTLVGASSGVNQGFKIAPNGSRVVYTANQDVEANDELYSVALDGTARIKHNGAVQPAGDVLSFLISPDSQRIVYDADQDTDQVFELFSASLAVAGSAKISGPLAVGGDVIQYKISPNSQQVAYLADQSINAVNEVYNTNILGGGEVKVNASLTSGEAVREFMFSSDSSRVLYSSDRLMPGFFNLYSRNLSGPDDVMLNPAIGAGAGVYDISKPLAQQIKVLGDNVYFRASLSTAPFNLYRINVTGGQLVQLNSDLGLGSNVSLNTLGEGTSFIVIGNHTIYRVDNGTNNTLHSVVSQ